MDAQRLHPGGGTTHAAGVPVPERGAEVGVLRLLGPGDRIKQIAGQVSAAVFPQADAGQAAIGQLKVLRQPALQSPHLRHHHRADLRALHVPQMPSWSAMDPAR
jgi:hypothetical protein